MGFCKCPLIAINHAFRKCTAVQKQYHYKMKTILMLAIILTMLTCTFALSKRQIYYVTKLLEQCNDYSLRVYFEDKTQEVLEVLLPLAFEYNMSVAICKGRTNIERPSGAKILNLVAFESDDFGWTPTNFSYDDRLLYLVDKIPRFIQNLSLFKLADVVILLSLHHLSLHRAYFDGVAPLNSDAMFPKKFQNLHGAELRVGYMNFMPYMYCYNWTEQDEDGVSMRFCRRALGVEYQLLKILGERMNFTFRVAQDVNSSFVNTAIEQVRVGRYDFVIGGISVTYERHRIITFSSYVDFDDFALLYMCRQTMTNEFSVFAMPFDLVVWLNIFFVIVVISVCLSCVLAYKDNKHRTLSFVRTLCLCLKALIQQTDAWIDINRFRRRGAAYVVFGNLLMFGIVVTTVFRTKLLSIFVRPPHDEPSSLEELLEHDYEIVINEWNRPFMDEILDDGDLVLSYVKKKGRFVQDLCHQVSHIAHNRAALMNEKSHILYSTMYECRKEIYPTTTDDDYDPERLRVTHKPVRSNPHAWAFRKEFQMWKPVSDVIGLLNNGGFIIKWTKDANAEGKIIKTFPYAKNNFPEDNNVRFQIFSFLLCLVGNLIGAIAFAIELLRSKLRRRIIRKMLLLCK